MATDDEILKEFLVESYENLDRMDREMLALEGDPTQRDVLHDIFRTIHTLKGASGFLGLSKIESIAHVGETLLSRLRDGALRLDAEMADALLALVDKLRKLLSNIEASGGEGNEDVSELQATLDRLSKQDPASALAPKAAEMAEPEPPPPPPAEEPAPRNIGDILIEQGRTSPEAVDKARRQQDQGDPRRIGEILVDHGAVKPQDVLEALHTQAEPRPGAVSENNIRVDVGLLDKLMNVVGELVLVRNQILQLTSSQEDAAILAASQRLNLITTELQEGVMKTRMQPIGNVWNKFPRVVRDLAASCRRKVRVEMDGKDTELDKTLIEAIKDPLTHLVRNAVDHGIESPDQRKAAGKPEEGRLFLRAYHEGGQVNIEISDDGAGINLERVRKKALETGLATPDQLARMSDREIINLIFLPGFSTAEKVTNVSGRGVGMDVVRTNIERIGGTFDVQSKPGEGTTVRIKIPLTLAIIPALIVTCGADRFAIPQVSLLELVRLEAQAASKGIEQVHGAPVYRLRGNLLPLVYLDRELAISSARHGASHRVEDGVVNIVVLQADGRPFGLVVDEVNDTEEIVVKALGKHLKGIPCFAGATIMGDGRVALILDVLGLAQKSRVVTAARDKKLMETDVRAAEATGERQTLLLFRMGADRRLAIPLSAANRLEEFPRSSIEKTDDHEVVQYRGRILPLVPLSRVLKQGTDALVSDQDPIQVVVYRHGTRSVGLVVERILDIVEESVSADEVAGHGGILRSAVIQGKVTDLLDVPGALREAGFCGGDGAAA